MAETFADWAATPGTVGIRLFLNCGNAPNAAGPSLNGALTIAARHALPVNLMSTGRLDLAAQLAERHPDTQLVIDHLGLPQPQESPAPAAPFADLPKLLAQALMSKPERAEEPVKPIEFCSMGESDRLSV